MIARRYDEPITGFSTATLVEFLGGYRNADSRAAYCRACRSWQTWLQEHEIRSDNPLRTIRPPKDPKRVPKPISTAAMD